MSGSTGAVAFLYGTAAGRLLLQVILKLHLDRIAVWFLRSRLSAPMIDGFLRKNGIEVSPEQRAAFRSYRDAFARTREQVPFDETAEHLISPCDCLLSAFPIDEKSCFAIKNSYYKVEDFLQDQQLARRYLGGLCLVLRLQVADYHHYCYIDDGRQGANHFIPGELHSVQPVACENVPVFVRNRRSWCLLETEHFGPVVQCEIGALVVGGIVQEKEHDSFRRGEEKGRFELAGSTIVLLLEKDRVQLHPDLAERLRQTEETPVKQGQWIATALPGKDD